MILSAEERDAVLAVRIGHPVKVWRFKEPDASDVGKRYVIDGNYYTVAEKKAMSAKDVMRTQPRGTFRALQMSWPENVDKVWLIVVLRGDMTDQPRLLTNGGAKGDYTNDPSRAMRDEPEALSESDLDYYAGMGRQHREAKLRELGDLSVEQVLEELKRPGLRREERKRLRYVLHALRKLKGDERGRRGP